MNTRLRFGQIGCGDIAEIRYLPAYQMSRHAALVTVCDTNGDRAVTAQQRYGAQASFTDYREMLHRSDIEAVVIATPAPTHAEIAIAAAEAGKHILIEKPLALTVADADRMLAAVARANVLFAPNPWDEVKSLRACRRMLRQGWIGRPVTVEATATHDGPAHGAWFYGSGGGVLNDMAIYPISWFTALLGPAARVVALSSIVEKQRTLIDGKVVEARAEDNLVLNLQWPDGVLGSITSNWATGGLGKNYVNGLWRGKTVFHMTVFGREGVLHADYGDQLVAVSSSRSYPADRGECFEGLPAYRPDLGSYSEDSNRTWQGPEILDHLAEAVLFAKPLRVNLGRQRHVLEIIEKAHHSIQTGTVQTLETIFELVEEFSADELSVSI